MHGGGVGYVWQGGMHGRGTCVAGGDMHSRRDGNCCGLEFFLLECILVEAVAVNHYFTEKSINIT